MTDPTGRPIDRMKSEASSHVNNQQAKAWWRSGLTRKTRNLVPSGASVRIRPTSKYSFTAGAFIFRLFPKKKSESSFSVLVFLCVMASMAESSRVERTSRSGQRQEPSHRRSAGRKVCLRNPPRRGGKQLRRLAALFGVHCVAPDWPSDDRVENDTLVVSAIQLSTSTQSLQHKQFPLFCGPFPSCRPIQHLPCSRQAANRPSLMSIGSSNICFGLVPQPCLPLPGSPDPLVWSRFLVQRSMLPGR